MATPFTRAGFRMCALTSANTGSSFVEAGSVDVVADPVLLGVGNEDLVTRRVGGGVLEHVLATHRVVVPEVPRERLAETGAGVPAVAGEDLHEGVPGQVRPDLLGRLGEDPDGDEPGLRVVVVPGLHLGRVLLDGGDVLGAPQLV